MSENPLFDAESVEAMLVALDPTQEQPSPLLPPIGPISAPAAPSRLRWLRDEGPQIDSWLVFPTYKQIAAEVDGRRLPGTYVHASTVVLKRLDQKGKIRPVTVCDISLLWTVSLERQLAVIYARVRHEEIVATRGRHLTEDQFDALPTATYKALIAAGPGGRAVGWRKEGPRAGRRTSQSSVVGNPPSQD